MGFLCVKFAEDWKPFISCDHQSKINQDGVSFSRNSTTFSR